VPRHSTVPAPHAHRGDRAPDPQAVVSHRTRWRTPHIDWQAAGIVLRHRRLGQRLVALLVHEAAHVYLGTKDESACNAKMQATQDLLAAR